MSTKILTLMYHRVYDPINKYPYDHFVKHLKYIAQQFPVILPGQTPHKGEINVCLTFDDAYYDFYTHVFPLLQQLNIPAIVAVPVKYILINTQIEDHIRHQVPYPKGMQEPLYCEKAPFCTWEELKTMAHSSLVRFASHSYSHASMANPQINQQKEIIDSKAALERQLGVEVPYFIYPYGNISRDAQKTVAKHYDYAFRIGSAINHRWQKLMYRVDAEHFWKPLADIQEKHIRKFSRKYWINRIRFK